MKFKTFEIIRLHRHMDKCILLGYVLFTSIATVEGVYKIYDMSTLCGTLLSMHSNNVSGIDMAMTFSNSSVTMATCNVTIEGRFELPSFHFYFADINMSAVDQAMLTVTTGEDVPSLQLHEDLPNAITERSSSHLINISYTSANKYMRVSLTWSGNTSSRGQIFRVIINSYICQDDCNQYHSCGNGLCIERDILQTGYFPCANTSTCPHDEDDGLFRFLLLVPVFVGFVVLAFCMRRNSKTRQCLDKNLQTCFRRCQSLAELTRGHCRHCRQTQLCTCSCTCICFPNTISDIRTATAETSAQTTPQHTEQVHDSTNSNTGHSEEEPPQHTEPVHDRTNSNTDHSEEEPPQYSAVDNQPPPYSIAVGAPPSYATYINIYSQIPSPPPDYDTVIRNPSTGRT